MKFLKLFWIGIFLLVLGLVTLKWNTFFNRPGQTKISETTAKDKTEIITYTQTIVPTEYKSGSCWTFSNPAVTNPKAWRCLVDNFIYDPCFQTDSGSIVCDVDPEDPSLGFELKLTKTLPNSEKRPSKSDFVWIVKLANGLRCELIQGTAGMVEGRFYYYSCGGNKYLIDRINTEKNLWMAKLATLSDPEHEQASKIVDSELISVRTVWR